MSSALAGLVSGFQKKYELTGLTEDEQGFFTLYVDDRRIQLFESLGKIYLAAFVRQMPAENFHRVGLLKAALKASLANATGYRVSLYLDERDDSLRMYQCVKDNELDLLAFEALIEKFMYALDGLSEFTEQSRYTNKPRLVAI